MQATQFKNTYISHVDEVQIKFSRYVKNGKKNQSKWCYISQQVNNTLQLDNKPQKQEIMHLRHTMSATDILWNTNVLDSFTENSTSCDHPKEYTFQW